MVVTIEKAAFDRDLKEVRQPRRCLGERCSGVPGQREHLGPEPEGRSSDLGAPHLVFASCRASQTLSEGFGFDPDRNRELVQGSEQGHDMTCCVGSTADQLEAITEVRGREARGKRVGVAFGRGTTVS